MNNLLNWLIILAVIATLVLSIVALVLPCKSGFEDEATCIASWEECKPGNTCCDGGECMNTKSPASSCSKNDNYCQCDPQKPGPVPPSPKCRPCGDSKCLPYSIGCCNGIPYNYENETCCNNKPYSSDEYSCFICDYYGGNKSPPGLETPLVTGKKHIRYQSVSGTCGKYNKPDEESLFWLSIKQTPHCKNGEYYIDINGAHQYAEPQMHGCKQV